jgi:C4-dicarboxylate-binding protein DctP
MEQSTRYANQFAKIDNDNALEMVRKSGKTQIYVPTKEELSAFKKAMIPVHKKMESRVGKETIDAVYKATGFNPAKL